MVFNLNKCIGFTKIIIYAEHINMQNNIFDIHFNGGRPFRVEIDTNKHNIIIYKINDDIDENGENVYNQLKIVKKYEYVFVPHDSVYGFHGNTILIELYDKVYMYIGERIYTFQTREKIIDYKSPMGNSDVPYPFATSENYYYLMNEEIYYDKMLAKNNDPYGVYYGHIDGIPEIQKNDIYKMEIMEDTRHTRDIIKKRRIKGKKKKQ